MAWTASNIRTQVRDDHEETDDQLPRLGLPKITAAFVVHSCGAGGAAKHLSANRCPEQEPAMTIPLQTSPLAAFVARLRAGRLAYQYDPREGRAVFFPRVIAPGHGGPLEWRDSAGLGTVYSTTTVHPRHGAPYNVALIDMDEGFRLMSCVLGLPPGEVRIGQRVRVEVEEVDGDDPRPVFRPLESGA